ncbi:MAG TPA: hypothetical protein VK934_08705 [Fimbriimonas sp.]|nr:hypothetical protein [Fimbriimonas sp.]
MRVVTLETTVGKDGIAHIPNLPPGERVQVTILASSPAVEPTHSLRGTPFRLDKPFDPMIPEDEWDSLL